MRMPQGEKRLIRLETRFQAYDSTDSLNFAELSKNKLLNCQSIFTVSGETQNNC